MFLTRIYMLLLPEGQMSEAWNLPTSNSHSEKIKRLNRFSGELF